MNPKWYIQAHCPLLFVEVEARISAGSFDPKANIQTELGKLASELLADPIPGTTPWGDAVEMLETALQNKKKKRRK